MSADKYSGDSGTPVDVPNNAINYLLKVTESSTCRKTAVPTVRICTVLQELYLEARPPFSSLNMYILFIYFSSDWFVFYLFRSSAS